MLEGLGLLLLIKGRGYVNFGSWLFLYDYLVSFLDFLDDVRPQTGLAQCLPAEFIHGHF